MALASDAPVAPSYRYVPLRRDLALALLLASGFVALHWWGGFASLDYARGDNDSLLRMVQIRDLLGGQGWFDLHQYRMGPEGGFVMHWSRLVDLPIALIIMAAERATGDVAMAETFALIAWPVALFVAAMVFIIGCARSIAGDAATLPAAVVGAAALHFVNVFSPGAIDHHNFQLVLVLAMLHFLTAEPTSVRRGLLAGSAAALMLAVGMETLPYVVAGGGAVALAFLVKGEAERSLAIGFGGGLALAAMAAFASTIAPSDWLRAQCDAFSQAQLVPAIISGIGLSIIAAMPARLRSPARRLAALACLAAFVGAIVILLFPQCLGDPYAALDPKLKRYWLSAVTEAQPFWSIASTKPAMAVAYYVTPVLALALLAGRWLRGRRLRAEMLTGFLLAAAFAVSLWQVRGAVFSVPLAAIILAGWIARARSAAATGRPGAALRMAAAWLLSLNVAWSTAAYGAVAALGAGTTPKPSATRDDCYRAADYDSLARLPAGGVLASSNLGASILRHTPHRVLAGPYHRNVDGNLLALDAFMGPSDQAHAIAVQERMAYLAYCPGNPETGSIAAWAPDGLMAALKAGQVPDWLEPVAAPQDALLRLFRIRHD